MTETEMTDQQAEKSDVHSFGERLFAARTRRGLSSAEVAKAVNLTVDIIEAIERSDVDRLPQPAFVQGYIRVFARQVGVPEDVVLEEYSRAVPHARETVLRPRSALPDETNSGNPFVRIVSLLLLLAVVLAAVYAMYSYYSEMADVMAPAFDETQVDSLEIPYMEYPVEDVGAPDAGSEQFDSSIPEQPMVEIEPVTDESPDVDFEVRAAGQDTERAAMIETQRVAPGDDVLVLVANGSSWVEVVDSNGMRLQYDLVQEGRTVTLRGTAPFDVFLGNAPAMAIQLNNAQVDIKKYVRSNKIAHFKVAVSDSQVLFY